MQNAIHVVDVLLIISSSAVITITLLEWWRAGRLKRRQRCADGLCGHSGHRKDEG